MDENDCDFLLLSERERNALWLDIHRAADKAEAALILDRHDVTSEELVRAFPDLADVVRELPDQAPQVDGGATTVAPGTSGVHTCVFART
ncbi:hypothetical protein [Streptomyces griseosporeus]|uniref:hypothetical protein n=1 Tax=Streptomyces griseosporeus TaxID=1910 RepID=UPI0036821937